MHYASNIEYQQLQQLKQKNLKSHQSFNIDNNTNSIQLPHSAINPHQQMHNFMDPRQHQLIQMQQQQNQRAIKPQFNFETTNSDSNGKSILNYF